MKLTETEIAQIDRYTAGEMAEEELAAFEQRRVTDAEFATEVHTYIAMEKVFLAGKRQELKQLAQNAKLKYANERKANFNLIAGIAASILLLLIPFSWWLFSPSSTSGPDLYAQHYEQYSFGGPLRDPQSPPTAYEKAWGQYLELNFEEALTYFETIQEGDPFYEEIQFFSAISYLNTNEIPQSISLLSTLANSPNHPLTMEAKWYLALAYLKSSDLEKAKTILTEIQADEESYKRKAAEEILAQLNR